MRRMLRSALGVVLAWSASLSAQDLVVGTTLQGSTGRFIFEEPTTSWMLLIAASLESTQWRLGASLPLVYQNSNAVSYIAGTPVGTGGPNGGTVADRSPGTRIPGQRRQGAVAGGFLLREAALTVDSGYVEAPGPYELTVGDPIISAGTDLTSSADGRHRLMFQASVKLPLASVSSGVGTGATDVGLSLALSSRLERMFVFADVSHWRIGDLPDLPLRDITGVALGLGRAMGFDARHSLLLSATASTSVVPNVDPPRSVSLGYGYILPGGRSLNVGGTAGLSEAVADWTFWVGVRTVAF